MYEAQSFSQALDFQDALWFSSAAWQHNIGNSSYRMYQMSRDINFLKASQQHYAASLEKKEHADTRFNYDFVTKLLESAENEASQTSKEQDQNETESQENNSDTTSNSASKQDAWEQKTDSGSQESSSPETQSGTMQEENQSQSGGKSEASSSGIQQNSRPENYKLSENQNIADLSPEQMKELEEYIEWLKQEQMKLQPYYGKRESENNFDQMFDTFFEKNFWGNGEKDW